MSHRDEYEVLESGILEPLPDDTVQSFESYDVVPVAPIVTRELSKIVFHETTKHLGSVLDYLAILAWNRVVMRSGRPDKDHHRRVDDQTVSRPAACVDVGVHGVGLVGVRRDSPVERGKTIKAGG